MRIGQSKIYLQETALEGPTRWTRSRFGQLSQIILEPMALDISFRLETSEVGWSLAAVALYAQTTPIRSEICLV